MLFPPSGDLLACVITLASGDRVCFPSAPRPAQGMASSPSSKLASCPLPWPSLSSQSPWEWMTPVSRPVPQSGAQRARAGEQES